MNSLPIEIQMIPSPIGLAKARATYYDGVMKIDGCIVEHGKSTLRVVHQHINIPERDQQEIIQEYLLYASI